MAVGHWNVSVVDLIPEYRMTRRKLMKAREEAKAEARAWEEEMREGEEKQERARAACQVQNWEAYIRDLGNMIADVDYILNWLETGRNPNSVRGVERRYERPWPPEWLDRYQSPAGWSVERETVTRELTEDERFRIEEAMRDLSQRERQCFMMYVVDGMSYGEIARELHLAKGAVQTHVQRAREKIELAKATSLFLV